MTGIIYYAYEYLYFLCYASPSNQQFSTTEHMKYHRSTYSKMGQHPLSTHMNHTEDDVCLSFFFRNTQYKQLSNITHICKKLELNIKMILN